MALAMLLFWLAVLSFLIGVGLIIFYYLTFKVTDDVIVLPHRLDSRKYLTSGLNFGLMPHDATVIRTKKNIIFIDEVSCLKEAKSNQVYNKHKGRWEEAERQYIKLPTPDDGFVGVIVSVMYSPDLSSKETLETFAKAKNIEQIIASRVRSALHNWIRQKPLPGTTRRALMNKTEAEEFVLQNLLVMPKKALVLFNDSYEKRRGTPIYDLGAVIHEVSITDMQELQRGTGKPIWGDENMNSVVDAKIAHLRSSVQGIQQFRDAVKQLVEAHPDQQEFIEDMLYQHELSLKEFKND